MYKFLCSAIIVTSLSLGYVAQQVQVLEYSYKINSSKERLSLLIDRNEGLRYNVASLESPANLKQRLIIENIQLGEPGQWRNIKLAKAGAEEIAESKLPYEHSFKIASQIFVNIFTPKAEAIAQDLK